MDAEGATYVAAAYALTFGTLVAWFAVILLRLRAVGQATPRVQDGGRDDAA